MPTIAFATLGCKVNQYDTQALLEQFTAAGYQCAPFGPGADVYVVNTCTVTGVSDAKSRKLIRRAARWGAVVVTGCMAQREGRALAFEGVRLVLGMRFRDRAAQLLEQALAQDACLVAVETQERAAFLPLRVTAHEGRARAVLKIQEGCDRRCSYCAIPLARGPSVSMALDLVDEQAGDLARAGYREIVLTGVHLMSYGKDLSGGAHLATAVQAAAKHVPRVRLGSLEPPVPESVLDALCTQPALMAHFHLSLQSGSAAVLERMRRAYTPEGYARTVEGLRTRLGLASITTDIIVGFPGETDEAFAQTLAFAEKMAFAHIHVFPYSPRAGTEAASMPQVPEAVKTQRAAALTQAGARMERAFAQTLVGSTQPVLIERVEGELAEGLTPQRVRVAFEANGAAEGDIANVRIAQAHLRAFAPEA